jgi:hypothetical protein
MKSTSNSNTLIAPCTPHPIKELEFAIDEMSVNGVEAGSKIVDRNNRPIPSTWG